jgi:hypothetical protein
MGVYEIKCRIYFEIHCIMNTADQAVEVEELMLKGRFELVVCVAARLITC